MGKQSLLPWPFPWQYAIAIVRFANEERRPCGCGGDRGAHRHGCALRKRGPEIGVIQDTIGARATRRAAHAWLACRVTRHYVKAVPAIDIDNGNFRATKKENRRGK